jgi:hypothetical protein
MRLLIVCLAALSLALPCSPAAMACPPVDDGGGSFGSAYGAAFAVPVYTRRQFRASRFAAPVYGAAVVAAPVVHTRAFAAPVYAAPVVAAPVVAVPVRAVGPIRGAISGFRAGLRNRLNGF